MIFFYRHENHKVSEMSISITSFVDTILEHLKINSATTTRIEITLDVKLYPNAFGINVRPIQVFVWNRLHKDVLNITDMIKLFDKIPYICIKESKYRRLSREPNMIIVNPIKKKYENHEYYDYKIVKLFLQDELELYERIKNKTYEVIKQHLDNKTRNSKEFEIL